jgi:hypothetical protein
MIHLINITGNPIGGGKYLVGAGLALADALAGEAEKPLHLRHHELPVLDVFRKLHDHFSLLCGFLFCKSRQMITAFFPMDNLTSPSSQLGMLLQGFSIHMQPATIQPFLGLKLKPHPDLTNVSPCLSIGFVIGQVAWVVCDSCIEGVQQHLPILGEQTMGVNSEGSRKKRLTGRNISWPSFRRIISSAVVSPSKEASSAIPKGSIALGFIGENY